MILVFVVYHHMKHQLVINHYPNKSLFYFTFLVGACAHLTSFSGSDTISGCVLAQNYYLAKEIAAFSIPASEHSTMTSWTRLKERDAYENFLGKDKLLISNILYLLINR